MRGAEKLTALKVTKLKQPGRYGDGRGLWLHVGPTGTKSWVFRFMRDGVAREMGLGALHTIGLADARERARAARRTILDGIDPIEVKQAKRQAVKVEEARGITFDTAAEQFISAHESSWRSVVHRAQWRATLTTYAAPIIGALPVAAVDTALVLKVIEPIWQTKPETAGRVRQRIERVLDWARVRGFRDGDNPARWKGHLDKLLPTKAKVRRVRHHPAMAYAEIGAFMAALRELESVSARALEFTILTAGRTGEVIGARWDETDVSTKVWIVPGERMKAGREHRVPLCERGLEILSSIPREGEFVFPGGRANRPLSNMAMAELLKGMNGNGFTVHGFRSTFRDWAYERTNYPREIVEAALAHTVKDKVEAAYKRGDALEKRRRLMRDWSRFCSTVTTAAGVIPIKSSRT